MNISLHIIVSALAAWLLYPFVGLVSLGIIVGGVLIDADRYFYSLFRFKDFSLRRSYRYHYYHTEQKHYDRDILHIFHTTEFFALMMVLSLYNSFIFFILQGMILHILMDFIVIFSRNVLDARALSLIRWLQRRGYL